MTVFTIGYEGIDIDTFLDLLSSHNIETVVDIRETPVSRKKGFSKKSLENLLNLLGLEYVHMVELGCPKDVRNNYRQNSDWNQYTLGFMKHLEQQEQSIKKLSDMSCASNCALLCYEADYNYCHRSMVANAVSSAYGGSVKHITVHH